MNAPEGWKLVPIEPTVEMCNAGGFKWEAGQGFPIAYRALLAAAPAAVVQAALTDAQIVETLSMLKRGAISQEVAVSMLSGVSKDAAVVQAEPSEWISVDERLPVKGEHVIVYRPTAKLTQDEEIRIVRFKAGQTESWQGVVHGFDGICHPTHWMPLPAAPKVSP